MIIHLQLINIIINQYDCVKLTDSETSGLGTIFFRAKLSVMLDYRNSTVIIMINIMKLFLL